MTKNIIFGKNSKLTSSIVKNLNNVQVFSPNNFNFKNLNINDKTKVNFIFNNFYPSFKLNNLKPNDYKEPHLCHQPKQYDISEMIKHAKKDIEYSIKEHGYANRYEYEKLETLKAAQKKFMGGKKND